NHQRLCFSLALWNERDSILKERLFGLSGPQGNHGEDVKECYYYLDSTPTHTYMKCLYKYPQAEFPYARLLEENQRRTRNDPEFELIDTGIFNDDRYFDVFVEYAKADVNDILVRISVTNRGPANAPLHVLPHLWFRNQWSWGGTGEKPLLAQASTSRIEINEPELGGYELTMDGLPQLLFTENETNTKALWNWEGHPGVPLYAKDAFHRRVVHGQEEAVNPALRGTKACAWYKFNLAPGQTQTIRLRLTLRTEASRLVHDIDGVFAERMAEAEEFYSFANPQLSPDGKRVQRQALAGLLWSRQYYHFVVADWLKGDPGQPKPPASRLKGRDSNWVHIYNEDVLTMPDKWEYPWYAAWDLAFHMIPLALVDPDNAKAQLKLFLREWYMHPNGQIPAYEWAFGDVNPPVHAWACWRVFTIDRKLTGRGDYEFLETVFHKLLMNFTWWVNRKDSEGNNIFEGGFLGLDNIGVFDRSKPLPNGGLIEQSDGTSWMAMYCLNMLRISQELAVNADPLYEDIANKFFEHFLYIAHAINGMGGEGLWQEEDGFFYDRLSLPDGPSIPMRVRSMVGVIPLFAVDTMESALLESLPGFEKRMNWFIANRPDLCQNLAPLMRHGVEQRHLLSLVSRGRLVRVLEKLLDENEFLSPHGIRSVSKYHEAHPYELQVDGNRYRVGYEPAESSTGLFGGNSNWRGPVWFPVNYLLIESLQRFHFYFGEEFTVEFPTGSGVRMHLGEVAAQLSRRLSRLFLRDDQGRRPVFGGTEKFQSDPHFRDYPL
ncbi:MAG: glucosidase, partial [Acidobacteriota bacterium]|nr:glucosidase [Acidobacteriota bacterium]